MKNKSRRNKKSGLYSSDEERNDETNTMNRDEIESSH